MKNVHSHRGFTLMELMVTTIIVSILGGVAVPKYFNVIETTRQKVDLTKLYHLRDALNIALIEDLSALSNYTPIKNKNHDLNKLEQGLKSDAGATLFVIELHNGLSINVQGEHGSANNSYNICRMIGNGGTWYTALKESGFEGVAEIIADRLTDNNKHDKIAKSGQTYSSTAYKNSRNETDYRTAPKKPLFTSKALNHGTKDENTRYTMSVRWTEGMFGGTSVEVYLLPLGKTYEAAYRTDQGVCFSTYGRRGCANSGKRR